MHSFLLLLKPVMLCFLTFFHNLSINPDGILHNVVVVKCQMWQVRHWPPFCFGSIILAGDSDRLIDDGQISNSNGSSPWVLYSLPFSRSFKNRFSRKVRKYGKV